MDTQNHLRRHCFCLALPTAVLSFAKPLFLFYARAAPCLLMLPKIS